MGLAAQSITGYYPTPDRIVDKIRARITFPDDTKVAVLDPCCGDGLAFERFASGSSAVRYAIEPDNALFESASKILDRLIHSRIEDCRIANKSFSLVWLNPPYDWEHLEDGGGKKSERKEISFLKRCIPWLTPGGILVYIIPESIWNDPVRKLLANKFDNLEVWRFPEPDYYEFRQLVVIGRRKERDCADPLPLIREAESFLHTSHFVPASNPEVKLFHTTKVSVEEVKRLVSNSPCWKKFLEKSGRLETGTNRLRRPPLPLHSGHLSLMLAAGVLDGVVGNNGNSHVVKGKVTKTKITSVAEEVNPETGETITIRRELDGYRVTVKVLEKSGIIRELS